MESISPALQEPISIVISVLLFVFIIAWMKSRAGSSHVLYEKLWRIFGGHTDPYDRQLKSWLERNRDLEFFRVVYGIMVETTTQLHSLIAWMDAHRLSIRSVQQAKDWIDLKKTGFIVTPSRGFFLIRAIAALALAFLLGASSLLFASHEALLQIRPTGTWFMSNGDDAFYIDGLRLRPLRCTDYASGTTSLGSLSRKDENVICSAINHRDLQNIVTNGVKSQRILGASVTCLAFAGYVSIARAIVGALAAAKIVRHTTRQLKGVGGQELPA